MCLSALLAKALAKQTSATFLRVVGSELIQKYPLSYFTFSLSLLFYFLSFTLSLSFLFLFLTHTFRYLGDGPKLVRELFRVANDLAPSIVFIDEIDAVGTKRYDSHSGGEKEIQVLFSLSFSIFLFSFSFCLFLSLLILSFFLSHFLSLSLSFLTHTLAYDVGVVESAGWL